MIFFGENGDLYLRRFGGSLGAYQNKALIGGDGVSFMTVDGFFVSIFDKRLKNPSFRRL
jgi:hypothetical protein